ncbi:replication endonuclease [Aliikangiella sp. G2MR2-5]|uniref:replication endonuclease n=1 Tax=Aliikangiella sp. G2MR2-5 TaxID=2788943 RepID=UPI0018A88BE4|nr:replication endonuclease [Aliikangiella sp. G2MR2-5]
MSLSVKIHPHDKSWVEGQTSALPNDLKYSLISNYLKQPSRRDANIFLRQAVGVIKSSVDVGQFETHLKWGEDDLRSQAKLSADHCTNRIRLLSREINSAKLLTVLSVKGIGHVEKPVNEYVYDLVTIRNVYVGLKRYAESKSINMPIIDEVTTFKDYSGEISDKELGKVTKQAGKLLTTLARLTDYSWWLKQLRKSVNRKVEISAHAANLVNRKKGIYASDASVNRRKAQVARSQKMLSEHEAVNELGDRFTLADLSDKNVSNPAIRRAELMVRIRGTEDYANQAGLKGVFLTITCPSKYHRSFSKTGKPNPKWKGYTPRIAQEYLNSVWQRIRAAFQRANIKPLGVRVAEPQHDGTPHWHLLLFVCPEQMKEMVDICRHYALLEDGEEKGASTHRLDVTPIDPEIGSATGYIAKYICKNIDGANLDSGTYGEDPIIAAQRVDTWRSVWGIRQFEFIGGCSVTVWRELRRLPEDKELPEEVEEIRKAADSANWGKFNELMGGFFCKRKEQALRPYYSFKFDSSTGEIKESRYGDSFIEKLLGVVFKGQNIITRFHEWRVEKIGATNFLPLEFCK